MLKKLYIYQDNKKWSVREQIKVMKGLFDKEEH